jgi:hypothetical protein
MNENTRPCDNDDCSYCADAGECIDCEYCEEQGTDDEDDLDET